MDAPPLRIAVLGNAGSWYCADLERAAAARGHRCLRVDFPRLTAGVAAGPRVVATEGRDLTECDVVIVRTMPPGSLEQVVFRMDVLARLQATGVTVINSPKALECAVDKYLTLTRLEAAGLPVPSTVTCEHADAALEAFEQLGGDVLVKPLFGAEGRGILRVSDRDLAFRTFRTLERIGAVLYLQRFIAHEGCDVRVLVLDGQVIGGMRRCSAGDYRTNVARAAKAEPYQLDTEEESWALRAAAATGTRFAGVDLLTDREGRRYVIEVNAVPGWKAFSQVNGCDVAGLLIASCELHQSESD